MNYIDSHLHLGRFNAGIYGIRKKKRSCLLRGTKLGIISSLNSATVSQEHGNKETFDFIHNSPCDFKGLIWINPYDPHWRKDAQKYLNYKEFVGIKLHSSLNRYYPTRRILNPVLNFAQTYKLPVVIHTGSSSNYCNAKVFTNIIQNFPNVTFVLYHMNPSWEAIELCCRFKNVYLEVSGQHINQVKEAVEKCGSKKVIFGSDEHIVYQKRIPSQLLNNIKKTFSLEDQKNILFANAKKVFKLK